MKNRILIFAFMLFAAVAAVAQKRQIVDNPYYESTNTSIMEINRIETDKKETVVSATLWYRYNYWVRLATNMVLKGRETGKEYKMLRVEGIEPGKETFMPVSNRMDIKIYFEPISREEKSVDFSEISESGAWWINGISLDAPLNMMQGSWEEVGNAGNVVAAFVKDRMLYGGKVWSYTIDRKGKNITINIASDGKARQLFAVQKSDGTLLLKESRSDKGILLTRNAQAVPESDYSFDPNRATPFFFKGGKALIKGVLVNRKADTEEQKIMKVYMYNNIVPMEKESELVDINPDGTFELEIDLPHPQYLYLQEPLHQKLFVVPGDTVTVCFDCVEQERGPYKNCVPAVLGHSLSAQLIRYTSAGERAMNEIGNLKEVSAVSEKDWANDSMAYAYAHNAAPLFSKIFEQAPAILAKYPLSPIAKDIITTNVATDVFVNIMDVTMLCKASVSLPECYYFLKEDVVRDNLLNNNYLFCNNSNWIVFNRFAFELYYPYFVNIYNEGINKEFRNRPEFANRMNDKQLSDAEQLLSYGPHFLGDYNGKVVETASVICYDSIPTKGYIYRKVLERMEERLGIGNCMLFQRSIVEAGLQNEKVVNNMIEKLAGAMPFFTNPLIATNALAALRRLVAETEGGAKKSNMRPEVAEFLESLNKKYPGEHVIIDFWGLGCGPCRAGMLNQRELVEKYAGKVRFVYVCDNLVNPDTEVKKFFTDNNIKGEDVRVSADMWKILCNHFKFSGIPHYEVLLKDGSIADGFITSHISESLISEILKRENNRLYTLPEKE